MTADIRTAARTEAFSNHYSHKQVRDRYDADLLITGFMDGAAWAAARVTPTRESIARKLYETCWGDMVTWGDDNELFYDYADAILALMAGLAEGESDGN